MENVHVNPVVGVVGVVGELIPCHIFETQVTKWLDLKHGLMLAIALGKDAVRRYLSNNAEAIWFASRREQKDFVVGDVYVDRRNDDYYAVAPVTQDSHYVVFLPIQGPAGLRPRRISKKWCRGWDIVTLWGDSDACVLKRLDFQALCDCGFRDLVHL